MQKTFETLVGKLDYVKEIRPAESVDVSQIRVHSLIKYQNVMDAYRMRWCLRWLSSLPAAHFERNNVTIIRETVH
jgi:hypothetical protein